MLSIAETWPGGALSGPPGRPRCRVGCAGAKTENCTAFPWRCSWDQSRSTPLVTSVISSSQRAALRCLSSCQARAPARGLSTHRRGDRGSIQSASECTADGARFRAGPPSPFGWPLSPTKHLKLTRVAWLPSALSQEDRHGRTKQAGRHARVLPSLRQHEYWRSSLNVKPHQSHRS